MKVLHLAGESAATGAGRGVLWLHQGLANTHIDSSVLFQFGTEEYDGAHTLHSGLSGRAHQSLISRTDALPLKRYPKRNGLFSTGWLGNDVSRHPLYREADIIHLHWVNRAMLSTRFIGSINKPLVWTLRDMWPMTGGCHYDLDCHRYQASCGNCPQLGSDHTPDLSTRIQTSKQRHWQNSPMHLVAISHWLKECSDSSAVFKNQAPAQVIPNCVDTDDYQPVDRAQARRELGIASEDRVVLCGAQNLNSSYKGFDRFLAAAGQMDKNTLFVFFGRLDEQAMQSMGIRYKNLGFLSSSAELSKAYSAADVFVAPSLQEAFGKTLIESMACGTPVVCFDATGPKDIIEHLLHGYKAAPFSVEDLAAGMEWVLSLSPEVNTEMRMACRQRVIDQFSLPAVANQYAILYDEVLRTHQSGPSPDSNPTMKRV